MQKTSLINKIDISFRAATRGQESVHNMIWWWGGIGYALSYFVIDSLIKKVDVFWVDIFTSLVAIIYFIWHIYALKKCQPKKAKLSKEEKKRLKIIARQQFVKKFFRKLFLQEPITKWDPVFITIVIDLLCITHFLSYIL
jgi:hypothetical protein